jgi:hypothetical protein
LASTGAKKAERVAGAAAVAPKGTKSGKIRQVPLNLDAVIVLRRVKATQAPENSRPSPGEYFDVGFVFLTKRIRIWKNVEIRMSRVEPLRS